MARDAYWDNKDGLVVGFGTRTPSQTGGFVNAEAATFERKLFLRIKGEDLGDTVAATDEQLVFGPTIPSGAFIESAQLEVTEAFVGATAVLDIGVYNAATEAAVDDDGIDAAVAVTAIDAIGDSIACDGALVDTVLAQDSKIAASYDTAAFTAGEAVLTVVYYYPMST